MRHPIAAYFPRADPAPVRDGTYKRMLAVGVDKVRLFLNGVPARVNISQPAGDAEDDSL